MIFEVVWLRNLKPIIDKVVSVARAVRQNISYKFVRNFDKNLKQ